MGLWEWRRKDVDKDLIFFCAYILAQDAAQLPAVDYDKVAIVLEITLYEYHIS